jgi:hypothetical protein
MKKKGYVALKAGKGDAIVILREEQYSNNMKYLIKDCPYIVENQFPVKKITI